MKKFAIGFALVTAALAFAQAAKYISVDALQKDTKKYDKKDVVVRGKVKDYKAKTSKAGNKYTTFKLLGEKKEVNIYMREHPAKPLKDGQLVEVNGVYRVEKKVGDRVFKNEIEITAEKGKKYGVKTVG